MKILLYFGIFTFMLIEEALKTLRIIVVSNGKKILGAILQFFIAIIWIIVTGSVIINIQKDLWKIFFYALGSLVGSYIGSYIEEKIAWGTNILMVEINNNITKKLIEKLKQNNYKINELESHKKNHELIIITTPRKKTNDVIKIIRTFDQKANIISEKAKVSFQDYKHI